MLVFSDQLEGNGEHELIFRFHLAPGLGTSAPNGSIDAYAQMSGSRLIIGNGLWTAGANWNHGFRLWTMGQSAVGVGALSKSLLSR